MSVYVTPHPLPYFIGGDRATRPDQDATSPAPLAPPASPALVQSATANTGTTEPASLDVVLASPATAGNLIVVAGNSDATMTGFSGAAVAASAIFNQGAYLWYKVAVGGETTLTITPSVARSMALVAAEYSGLTTTSPLDVTASNTGSGTTVGPISTGTTGATAQNVELVLAVGGPHSYTAAVSPNTPTWTNGFATVGEAASGFATGARNAAVFLGSLVTSATGTQTTGVSWTESANDWGALIAAFKGA